MSPIDPLTGEERSFQPNGALMLVVSSLDATPNIGRLAKYNYVYNVRVDVETAFDAGTTLKIGHPDDDDAYTTATAVDATGVKTPTLGAGIGYDATPRLVQATLSGTPTVGKAVVIVEFYRVPRVN